MRFLRFGLALLLGLCLFSALPVAAQPYYVTSDDLPALLLPPPPKEGGAAWKKNIQGVLYAQAHIEKDDLDYMRDEQHLRIGLLTEIFENDISAEKFPVTYQLLQRVFEDSELIASADKQFWHTRRPYLADTQVRLYVDRIDKSPAYPSGHTTTSRVLAEVLGILYPDRLDDLRLKADSIAYHRIQAGVHYPIDVEGGKLLAMLIVGALMNSNDFQSDLAAAKEEVNKD